MCLSCNLHLPRTHYQDNPYNNEMAQCFYLQLPIERAAALFFYRSHSSVSNLIYDLKYHNRPEIGEQIGRMIAHEFTCAGFFEGIDAIVPVPLARSRQRRRGYNQSMQIAVGVSQVTHIPIENRVVKRKHFKGSQTTKARWERAENVENAFALRRKVSLAGKHVLIVDDVVTSGATVIACATVLKAAGNPKVSVLSIGFTKG